MSLWSTSTFQPLTPYTSKSAGIVQYCAASQRPPRGTAGWSIQCQDVSSARHTEGWSLYGFELNHFSFVSRTGSTPSCWMPGQAGTQHLQNMVRIHNTSLAFLHLYMGQCVMETQTLGFLILFCGKGLDNMSLPYKQGDNKQYKIWQ